jgi:hypothetical protein
MSLHEAFLATASGQIFKDDVHIFSSTSYIFFMPMYIFFEENYSMQHPESGMTLVTK